MEKSQTWDLFTLAEQLAGVVRTAEDALRCEQAVYGLDSRDEREMQTLLAEGLAADYEVAREVHYPSSAGNKLSHRLRCDIVLTPRGRVLRRDAVPAGLFDSPDAAGPDEALWLEVKVAYQFREGGIRHAGYGAQWRTNIVSDLLKMESDPLIRHAALVLVVFNESDRILEKDLDLFETVLAQKEVLAGFRQVRSVPVADRVGHHVCTVAVFPTIQR